MTNGLEGLIHLGNTQFGGGGMGTQGGALETRMAMFNALREEFPDVTEDTIRKAMADPAYLQLLRENKVLKEGKSEVEAFATDGNQNAESTQQTDNRWEQMRAAGLLNPIAGIKEVPNPVPGGPPLYMLEYEGGGFDTKLFTAEDLGIGPTYQEGMAAIAPPGDDIEGYTSVPRFDSASQRWVMELQPKQRTSLGEEIENLWMSGKPEDIEKAQQLFNLANQPTQQDQLQTALQIASSPADFFYLMQLAAGASPMQQGPYSGAFRDIGPRGFGPALSLLNQVYGVGDQISAPVDTQQTVNQKDVIETDLGLSATGVGQQDEQNGEPVTNITAGIEGEFEAGGELGTGARGVTNQQITSDTGFGPPGEGRVQTIDTGATDWWSIALGANTLEELKSVSGNMPPGIYNSRATQILDAQKKAFGALGTGSGTRAGVVTGTGTGVVTGTGDGTGTGVVTGTGDGTEEVVTETGKTITPPAVKFRNLEALGAQGITTPPVRSEEEKAKMKFRGQEKRYAGGGIIPGPTTAILGEEGPEMVIPLDPRKRLQAERLLSLYGQITNGSIPRLANGGIIDGALEAKKKFLVESVEKVPGGYIGNLSPTHSTQATGFNIKGNTQTKAPAATAAGNIGTGQLTQNTAGTSFSLGGQGQTPEQFLQQYAPRVYDVGAMGRAISRPKQLARHAGITHPSAQAWRRFSPLERETFLSAVESTGIPRDMFLEEAGLANIQRFPSSPVGPARMGTLSLR